MNSAMVQIRTRRLGPGGAQNFEMFALDLLQAAASRRMSAKFIFDLKSGTAQLPEMTEIWALGSLEMYQLIF